MIVESDDDRAVFLSTDEFGDSAVYAKAAGGSATLSGVFDAPHVMIEFGDAPISDRKPTFLCRTSDVPAGAQGGDAGDRLTVDGETYHVVDLQPDGSGMTIIVLGK